MQQEPQPPSILDFMGDDTTKLLTKLQWVATHPPLVQLGKDAIEYVTQYGVSMVLSESTVEHWGKMLEQMGVPVAPVTMGKLARDAAMVAMQEVRTHPLDALREVQHVAHKVHELSKLRHLKRDDEMHGALAKAIMEAHDATTFDSLLAAGKTIYEDGSAWLHVGLPEVLASLTSEAAANKKRSGKGMRKYLTDVIGRAYNRWRDIGQRSGHMHKHVGDMEAVEADVSDAEEPQPEAVDKPKKKKTKKVKDATAAAAPAA